MEIAGVTVKTQSKRTNMFPYYISHDKKQLRRQRKQLTFMVVGFVVFGLIALTVTLVFLLC
jgi:hypothetical protein